MNVELIKAYYAARGLSWPHHKHALLFFLSEVGELAEAYQAQKPVELSAEEDDLLAEFSRLGQKADEIVSREPGWVRNLDRLRKENIEFEAADCEMMLSVFMHTLSGQSPDEALAEKMELKLGRPITEILKSGQENK